jgi:acetyl-CoA C-acetyltransferase
MTDIVIVSACRTAIGTLGGSLKDVKAPVLASIAIREAIQRAGIDPATINDVKLGNCMEPFDASNCARTAALLAGVPESVPAMTINRVCTSSMEAILSGAFMIQAGAADTVLAAGVESMSNVPMMAPQARFGSKYGDQTLVDGVFWGLHCGSHYIPYPKDGPVEWARGKPYIMGQTAEFLARKLGLTREEQDEVALRSHNNAEAATDSGRFADEIVPVTIPQRKGDPIVFDKDEHFRRGLTMEQLAALPTAFAKDDEATVTAGNSSGINDGASAAVIMSAEKADSLGIQPIAKLTGFGYGCCEPYYMGESPIPAVKNLMERTGHTKDDWELIELNEAFAAQYLAVEKGLELNREIINVNGSGIGLGHPVGMTGCRLVVTLLHEMKKRGNKRGLATLCGGGGISIATEWEML